MTLIPEPLVTKNSSAAPVYSDASRAPIARGPSITAAFTTINMLAHDLPLGCHSCHTSRRNDLRRRLFAAANQVQEQVVRTPGAIRHVYGPANVPVGENELVVLCIGREAAPWINSFVEHHLALGAKHIFFLDNDSHDDTIARLSRHAHVSVFTTRISFKRYEVGLRRWLMRTFGRNRWSLYCDADELFDYPYSDRLALPDLLRYLRQYGYNAVTGQMLDLFSDKPFSQLDSHPDDSLKDTYRFYDLTDLVPTRDVYWIRDGDVANHDITCLFGGIRKRIFHDDCLLLTKHPLVYADRTVGVYTYDGHFMSGARVADFSAALLHFKYVGSLPERVRRTVEQEWHNKAAALYGGLAGVLGQAPDLCLRLDTATELQGMDELVERGFLVVTPEYRRWVDAHGR